MRSNDLTVITLVFFMGLLMGVISTVAVYGSVIGRRADTERLQAEAALKKAEAERDDALARINDYLVTEQHRQLEAEQPRNDQLEKQPEITLVPPPAAKQPEVVAPPTGKQPEVAAGPSAPGAKGAPANGREAARPAKGAPAEQKQAAPQVNKLPDFGPPRQYGKD
jgi:hypothetical protein